jgi:hypothetical protein
VCIVLRAQLSLEKAVVRAVTGRKGVCVGVCVCDYSYTSSACIFMLIAPCLMGGWLGVGSISAEHGVGQQKAHLLPTVRSLSEVQVMRALKSTLDPKWILNPGKVLLASTSCE